MSTVAMLSDRLRTGSPMLSAWCGLPEPAVAGLLARESFDAVTLDMQHGSADLAAAVRALPLIAAAGKPGLVRIPVGDYATASRLLDAGASGVIAPMVNSVEDARRFAAFMKYPPLGERSWGPHGALTLSGLPPAEYFAQANGTSISFAMVETREALAIVDEILETPGVDGIFLGPSDLSIALSGGAGVNASSPDVEDALAHALARARAAGKLAGVYAATGDNAAQRRAQGFHFIAVGSDSMMLRAGAQAALKAGRA
jgi:4-hydroxy-2-oxoheptanedioate aldolase